MIRCTDCALRRTGAFKPLDEDEILYIDAMKRAHLALPAGAEIIVPGAENTELYTLYSGWAYRYKELPDGRRQILHFLLPGDLIGLQAAMSEVPLYGVIALTPVSICVLPRKRIWSLFGTMPELAFDVTWLGAREESHVDENLTTVGRRAAAERIAALLIGLYRRLLGLGLVSDDNSFALPLTQQHIADALGLSLVHTNKTMARLRRLGFYSQSEGVVTLPNPRALESLSQFDEIDERPRPLI